MATKVAMSLGLLLWFYIQKNCSDFPYSLPLLFTTNACPLMTVDLVAIMFFSNREKMAYDTGRGGSEPWSMFQFRRLYNCCRTPGETEDRIHVHFKTGNSNTSNVFYAMN